MSRNIVNLNEKLMFLLLYFVLFIYTNFARFANFCPYPWLQKVLLFGRGWGRLFVDILLIKLVGLLMGDINRDIVGSTSSKKNVIGIFFSLKLI